MANNVCIKWQDLENATRKLAESVWGVNATAESIAGVKCDCVLKLKNDYWIIVEISKQSSLDKVRTDLAKFGVIKPALLARNIYCECYFVSSGDFPSIIQSANSLNVEAHTPQTLANKFLGSSIYLNERANYPFGSAVNPESGEKDEACYIPTKYLDDTGKKHSLQDICGYLKAGKKIILVGEFGTGKSRCLMEIFTSLANESLIFSPLAINLRDNWGYKKMAYIVRNHVDLLGLNDIADPLIRSLRRGNHILLLDGIDEIGSQSWSGDPARLMEIRKISLAGVRDIVQTCKTSGILLTGREHYFSSDTEMIECLGLAHTDVLKLKCPDEFSDEEIDNYIRSNTTLTAIPEWMPRKPLVCQLLSKLGPNDVKKLEEAADGEVDFFESLFDSICERETRINPAIYKEVLKDILLRLAHQTRLQAESREQISTSDINDAFYKVAGYAPIDESAILLQRLPYLGRVGSGGSERIFVDTYARDGLRGLSLSKILQTSCKDVANEKWLQPIKEFGVRVMASKVTPENNVKNFIKYCINHGNTQIACDYIQLCIARAHDEIDFNGLLINGGVIDELNFTDIKVKNLVLDSIYIEKMTIENATFESVLIANCIINYIVGIGNADRLPGVFRNCTIEKFSSAFTISRISELNISNKHKTLLAIIKKLFFQPGSGRQEEALLRGAENYWDRNAASKVLQYMLNHSIITKTIGDHGTLYIPKRNARTRMANIWELQSNCNDELWGILS